MRDVFMFAMESIFKIFFSFLVILSVPVLAQACFGDEEVVEVCAFSASDAEDKVSDSCQVRGNAWRAEYDDCWGVNFSTYYVCAECGWRRPRRSTGGRHKRRYDRR